MFKIRTDKETISLSKEQLLQSLIQKVTDTHHSDHELLAKTIADYLEINGALKKSTPLSLIALAFSAGYYYKVFLNKNNVTIEVDDTQPTD